MSVVVVAIIKKGTKYQMKSLEFSPDDSACIGNKT